MENIKDFVSVNVRNRRNSLKMTQNELAESAKISIRAVQRVEGGERAPRGSTINAIAKALNCSIDELYRDPRLENFEKKSPIEQAMILTEAQLKALSEQLTKHGAQTALDAINKPSVEKYDDSPKGMVHKLIDGLNDDEAKKIHSMINTWIDVIRKPSQGRYIRPLNLRKDKK